MACGDTDSFHGVLHMGVMLECPHTFHQSDWNKNEFFKPNSNLRVRRKAERVCRDHINSLYVQVGLCVSL